MSIQVSPETEVRIIEAARQKGLSVDDLLTRLLKEETENGVSAPTSEELPAWNLGVTGSLRREDLYGDAF